MDNISFTSRIRFTTRHGFNSAIAAIEKKNYVQSPWSLKEAVYAPSAYTKDVFDCTTAAITDGQKVLLLHIDPNNPDNFPIENIEKFIKEKIDLTNEDLQGFILGGKYNNFLSPFSMSNFQWFEDFMNKFKIPTSKFKGGPFENDVAYISSKDEFIIGSSAIQPDYSKTFKSPTMILPKLFNEFEISKLDEVTW